MFLILESKHIEFNKELDEEIDIKRFNKKLKSYN